MVVDTVGQKKVHQLNKVGLHYRIKEESRNSNLRNSETQMQQSLAYIYTKHRILYEQVWGNTISLLRDYQRMQSDNKRYLSLLESTPIKNLLAFAKWVKRKKMNNAFQYLTPQKGNRLCVITPIYKDELSDEEWLSINACQKHLQKYDCLIIAPQKLKNGKLHKELTNQYHWIWFADNHFESIQSYNHLLLSYQFYESFSNYSYMLLYQTDAFIFNNKIEEWMDENYSFVGAPWVTNAEQKRFKLGACNGGFSLRKVDHIIKVLRSNKKVYPFLFHLTLLQKKQSLWRKLKFIIKFFTHLETFKTAKQNLIYNEDRIISAAWRQFTFFSIPSPETASQFAWENEPAMLYELNKNTLPLGCHAWQKYDKEFYTQFIPNVHQ